MLKAEPPAPSIKILAEPIFDFSCRSCINPLPSVDSAKISFDLFALLRVFAAPIISTIGEVLVAICEH